MPKPQFPDTDIYGITANEYSLGRSNLDIVRRMLDAGIRIIQYREKDNSQLQKYHECLEIRDMTAETGACFIINDDIQIALAVEADGVHLGQNDTSIAEARKTAGEAFIIGASVHSSEQAREAIRSGADYLGVGSVYSTMTKEDIQVIGPDLLGIICRESSVPVVAIGGIDGNRVGEVLSRGASGIAVVSAILGSGDPGTETQKLRQRID